MPACRYLSTGTAPQTRLVDPYQLQTELLQWIDFPLNMTGNNKDGCRHVLIRIQGNTCVSAHDDEVFPQVPRVVARMQSERLYKL